MLISDEYRALNAQMHQERADYGSFGHQWAQHVAALAMDLMEETGSPPTILDYGCGKSTLKGALPEFDVREYDPAIPGKDAKPEPADIVVCTDVLEHIEPDALGYVLLHLQNRTERLLFFSIATQSAQKTLADGRNAHLIVQPAGFWVTTLANHFVIQSLDVGEDHVGPPLPDRRDRVAGRRGLEDVVPLVAQQARQGAEVFLFVLEEQNGPVPVGEVR